MAVQKRGKKDAAFASIKLGLFLAVLKTFRLFGCSENFQVLVKLFKVLKLRK